MATREFFFRGLWLPALLGLAVLPLFSQAASAPLTLPDVLTRVETRHPRLTVLAFHNQAAAAVAEQAGLAPNPELGVQFENVLGTGALSGVRSLESTVQASQRFERGGKRQRRVDVAERDREIAEAAIAVERNELLREAALAFIALLSAQERARLAAEPLPLAQQTVAAVQDRVAAGAASPTEAARARAAVALAQMGQARAQAELASARIRLAALWAGNADDVPAVAGRLQAPDPWTPSDALAARIVQHPRMLHQQAVIASLRASVELEQAEAISDLTVGGGVRFAREGSDVGFVAGVTMPLPVRNRNQGGIRAARANLAGAEHLLHAIEAELRAAFTSAWQEMTAAHDAARELRQSVLPATDSALALVNRGYEAGELPLSEVLDAQRDRLALRTQLLELETAFYAAHVRLEAIIDPALPVTTALLASPQ